MADRMMDPEVVLRVLERMEARGERIEDKSTETVAALAKLSSHVMGDPEHGVAGLGGRVDTVEHAMSTLVAMEDREHAIGHFLVRVLVAIGGFSALIALGIRALTGG